MVIVGDDGGGGVVITRPAGHVGRYAALPQLGDDVELTTPAGWLVGPATSNAWDKGRIAAAFDGAFAYGPGVKMYIPKWPGVLSDRSVPLCSDRVSQFAAFFVDLVRIINIEQKRP